MNCADCGTANRDGAAFCRNCGHLLVAACPRCGAAAEPGANFCDTCGTPLSPRAWMGGLGPASTQLMAPAAPRLPARPQPPAGESALPTDRSLDRFIPPELLSKLTAARGAAAERRIVTLLFCDLKDSTAFAERFDAEEWTEIVNGAFEHMVRPIYKYEGTVARLMGDGLLAFFGAPIAHEDDPRRAVLSGLAIVDGIRAYRDTLPPSAQQLAVRVGINTGLVIAGAVGSDLRVEYSAIGDAINLAKRMEEAAAPGTVQVAADTYRLLGGQFEVEALGRIAVKGKAEPVDAYRVLGRATGAWQRAPLVRRAALVDRRPERELLGAAFDALHAGRGAIVFLTGEAGLGKTRLIEEYVKAFEQPARVFEAAAVSYESTQPFGLILRMLRQGLNLRVGDPPEVVREQIAAVLPGTDSAMQRLALETLFAVAPGSSSQEVSGASFAEQLASALSALWFHFAAGGPLVMALDDLQWADMSSAEQLSRLFALAEVQPALFLCALRRDRRSPGWRLKDDAEQEYPHRLREAALYPLTDGDSRALLADLLSGDLPETLQGRILAKAEGNPLYIEEIVTHLIERGHLSREGEGQWVTSAPNSDSALPDSLQALLTARVDRLDEDTRRTLQIASVIGRSFARATLVALVDRPDSLDRQLLDLQRMELIREMGRVPELEYAFHHALTHEATYQTILLKERRALHRRTAEVIEASGAGEPATAPMLAHHFLEAEAPDRALPYLIRAGEEALRLHATAEALAFCDRAGPIALSAGSSEQLAALYRCRGRTFELLSRFAEAGEVYRNLEELAAERADPAIELEALLAQGKLHANVTSLYDPERARVLMERALRLAETMGNRAAEVSILWNLVNIDRFGVNSINRAVANGERGLAMARELGLAEGTAYLLNDLGDAYGMAGRLAEAHDTLLEAQAHWRALGNEPMLADSLTSAGVWESFRGNLRGALALAEESYAIAARLDNTWGKSYSLAIRGVSLGALGEVGRSVEYLSSAIELAHEAGFVGGEVLTNGFVSRVYHHAGAWPQEVERARIGLENGRERLPAFAGFCLARLALGLLALGEVDEAAALLADPLADLEQEQLFVHFDTPLAKAEVALAQGDIAGCLRVASAAAARMSGNGAMAWLPDMQHLWARALIAAGRVEEARSLLTQAVETARAMGARATRWQHLLTWATLEEDAGNGELAGALRRESAAEVDFLAANTWPDALRASFLELVKHHTGEAAPAEVRAD